MARFRKKPIEVDAEQWFPDKHVPGVHMYQPPDAVVGGRGHGEQRFKQDPYPAVLTIHEEWVRVAPGDWIITEPDGKHHYPCKPAVFDATYDPV